MHKLPAKTGWVWIKQGLALFRKQPAEISTLFLCYMFLMMVLGMIPVLGVVLPMILVPVFAMSFMQACLHIEQGKRVYPNLLLIGWRSPALRRLLALGVFYLLAAALAVAVSAIADGGTFFNAMTGTAVDSDELLNSNIGLSMVISLLVYLPAGMAFWYAAPLIMWQRMPVGKALFYSFFAVRNNGRAFIVYGLSWLLLIMLSTLLVSTIMALLVSNLTATLVILTPLSIILTVVMYCSFYPTYTAVFGRPAPSDPAAPADNMDAR